ncbi:MAG: hypothetical protein WCL39_01425, partial [Armatimonadota bacterium]
LDMVDRCPCGRYTTCSESLDETVSCRRCHPHIRPLLAPKITNGFGPYQRKNSAMIAENAT